MKFRPALTLLISLVVVSSCTTESETTKPQEGKAENKKSLEDTLFNSGVIGYSKTSYKEACKRYIGRSGSKSRSQLMQGIKKALGFNDFESGLVMSEKLIELDPNFGTAYFLRGKCIYNSIGGSSKSAKRDFEKCLELGVSEHRAADALEYLARLAYDEKDIEESIELLTRAIKVDPDHTSYYKFRALMYVDRKEFEKAQADYDMCVKLEPDGMMVYFNRAKFYETQGRNEEALRDYEHLLANAGQAKESSRLKDKTSLVYKYQSRLYSKLGRHREAIEAISHAIELNQNLAEDYCIRGEEYLAVDDVDAAVRDFTRAIEISDGTSVDALNGRARAYEKSGRRQQASADRESALKIKSTPAEKPVYELRKR